MTFKEQNSMIMDDTLTMCQEDEILAQSVKDSVAASYVVYQSEDLQVVPERNKDMKVYVTEDRTFEAVAWYAHNPAFTGKKICCLDFANNHSVGGSPWVAGAQEECLCRSSTLYPCLESKSEDFYIYHRDQFLNGDIDEYGSDDLIYVPNVTVFKTDEWGARLLPEDLWYKTDVIACAAPQLRSRFTDKEKFRQVMTSRIKRILDAAEKEKVDVLVLGAFGCGAFHNPPEIVADIFASLINNYRFQVVEFAVYCRDDNLWNLIVFDRIFQNDGRKKRYMKKLGATYDWKGNRG